MIKPGRECCLLALVLACSGCEDTMPWRNGTWIGVAKSGTLYSTNWTPHQVLWFDIQEGPRFDSPGLHGSLHVRPESEGPPMRPTPVIVDRRYDVVDPSLYANRRLRIRGTIGFYM